MITNELISEIKSKINDNHKQAITGGILQGVLVDMVKSLCEVYPQTYTEDEKAQARANIDALSDHNGEITIEKLSLEVQAILNDVANKQNITDASLATIAKTIVGAINELFNGGVKDKSIATSKIEDGAITEPKLDTDLVNIITSAVQPADLASAIATALAYYVAKADIVDTTGSATDKVMSQHGVTEAIDSVTNKVTELSGDIVGVKMFLGDYIKNINKNIMISGNVGSVATLTESVLSGWGYVIMPIEPNTKITIAGRGGTSSPLYAILDPNGMILEKSTYTYFNLVTITTPETAAKIIVNNDFNLAPAPTIRIHNAIGLLPTTEILSRSNVVSLLEVATKIPDFYLDSQCQLRQSYSWDSYVIDLTQCVPTEIIVGVGGTDENLPSISFFSSKDIINATTLLSSYPFINNGVNIIKDFVVPDGAVVAYICNRKATTQDVEINGMFSLQSQIKELADNSSSNTSEINICDSLSSVYSMAYIKSDGNLQYSASWKCWLMPRTSLSVKAYCNDLSFYTIAFYSGIPSSNTFISGLRVSQANVLSSIELSEAQIPSNAKYILLASRTASGNDSSAVVSETTTESEKLKMVFSELNGRSETKRVYRDIPNTNDFVFIKDELWIGKNIYENGVAIESLPIRRYKFSETGDDLIYVGELMTDFGHWNAVDYNEANDCLIFSSSANAETTEGNYFVVVPNPLSLSGEVKKTDVGIIYNVDLGFKVNVVWGDSNLGGNNIIYALSNNAATLTTLLLLKDSVGKFNGEYSVLKTQDTQLNIGIGGLSYWRNKIYIGVGSNYSITQLDVTTLESKNESYLYYNDDGTPISGSTQGVCVNSQFLWQFVNVAGLEKNYLIQYRR